MSSSLLRFTYRLDGLSKTIANDDSRFLPLRCTRDENVFLLSTPRFNTLLLIITLPDKMDSRHNESRSIFSPMVL